MMKSRIRRRAIVINGRKTSVSVEDAFWEPLKEIASARRTSVANVVSLSEAHHQNTIRSSAIRVIVLEFYRDRKLPSWSRSGRHKSFPRHAAVGRPLGAERQRSRIETGVPNCREAG